MCSFGSCQTRFEFLSQFRKVRNAFECFVTVQIRFIFIDFRVCYFAFAFKTQNAPCVSRFKRVLFSDRFQFASFKRKRDVSFDL